MGLNIAFYFLVLLIGSYIHIYKYIFIFLLGQNANDVSRTTPCYNLFCMTQRVYKIAKKERCREEGGGRNVDRE